MDNKQKIIVLRLMAKDFMDVPYAKNYNNLGFYHYLKNKFNTSDTDIKQILGKNYLSRFIFGKGYSQNDIYFYKSLHKYKYERTKWCIRKMKKLEKLNDSISYAELGYLYTIIEQTPNKNKKRRKNNDINRKSRKCNK